MQLVHLHALNDFDEWRLAARCLLRAGLEPDEVVWRDPYAEPELFETADPLPDGNRPVNAVPPAFLALAQTVVSHSDPQRFALLYSVLWRLQRDRHVLDLATDVDVARLNKMASAVRRDSHKMKAFVRFKTVADDSGIARFAAWFEPDHFSLEITAPFFARRFDGMNWAIVTPYRSAAWDGNQLTFGEGGSKADVPSEDAVEDDWKTYFSSIFNPARLKVAMMKSEMPVKYWRNLPEAELIAPLIRGARESAQQMIERNASQPPSRHLRKLVRLPKPGAPSAPLTTLADARAAVQNCQRCPLHEHATQAVFGHGPERGQLMFVGEQPGDHEDLAGQPFVGPAGKVLDAALIKVGIDRDRVYLTNAVKHFKFIPRGKRRIHQRPDGGEVQACKFWLDLEIAQVRPRIIVALGATAAQSLLGKPVTISALRGAPIPMTDGTILFVTNHPSYLLRIPDQAARETERLKFETDLDMVRSAAEHLSPALDTA